MAYTLSRITCVFRRYTVTGVLADGTAATPDAVDFAVLPLRAAPDADTVWTSVPVNAGVALVLVGGPDVTTAEALIVPAAGGAMWMREVDDPEVVAVQVETFSVDL